MGRPFTVKHPTVSVVIPTHNRRERVEQAIQSVLTQTFDDFELLVVDDGSIDGTGEYLLTHLDDPRARVIQQPHLGVSSARNLGLALARGDWVALLDSDDERMEFRRLGLEWSRRFRWTESADLTTGVYRAVAEGTRR